MFKNNSKKIYLFFILILAFSAISLPLVELKAANIQIENPLNADSFAELFVGIADWIAGIVALLAVLMIVVGGFQYMVSGGNEEKTKQARQTIQWSLVGLVVVLLSWSLLNTLLTILGVE